MSESTGKPKIKDLDPKASAQNVKGGCPCCLPTDQLTRQALKPVRELTPDVSPPR